MRYQPFKFWSNELSKCVFSKSNCNEVGQIIYNISSPSIDNDCRCDHTRGYAFLHMPKQSCYCTPTQEDCTCYKKLCPSDYSLASGNIWKTILFQLYVLFCMITAVIIIKSLFFIHPCLFRNGLHNSKSWVLWYKKIISTRFYIFLKS